MCVCLGWQDPPFLREEGSYTGKKRRRGGGGGSNKEEEEDGKKGGASIYRLFFLPYFLFPLSPSPVRLSLRSKKKKKVNDFLPILLAKIAWPLYHLYLR